MRSRRTAIVAVTTVALVALAGCGGIPSGGPVQSGQFIDEAEDIKVGYAPGGPQAGDDQRAILQGFINAATNPADNYAVAKQFLSESSKDEWNPDALTQIRTDAGVPRADSETAGSYTLTSSAYVNDKGQYVEDEEPTSQILQFGFEQDHNGEWRISSAPPGIVLSQASFDSIFDARSLYFFVPKRRVPHPRPPLVCAHQPARDERREGTACRAVGLAATGRDEHLLSDRYEARLECAHRLWRRNRRSL